MTLFTLRPLSLPHPSTSLLPPSHPAMFHNLRLTGEVRQFGCASLGRPSWGVGGWKTPVGIPEAPRPESDPRGENCLRDEGFRTEESRGGVRRVPALRPAGRVWGLGLHDAPHFHSQVCVGV